MLILNKFLESNYNKLLDISKTITGSKNLLYTNTDADDLLHETVVILYEKINKKTIRKLIKKKQLIFFIVRIMINQYHSNSSPYYTKYKKYYSLIHGSYNTSLLWTEHWLNNLTETNEIKEKEKIEQLLIDAENKLGKLNWFDAEIFKIYYLLKHTIRSLSKETGISKTTIYKSITNIKKQLKND